MQTMDFFWDKPSSCPQHLWQTSAEITADGLSLLLAKEMNRAGYKRCIYIHKCRDRQNRQMTKGGRSFMFPSVWQAAQVATVELKAVCGWRGRPVCVSHTVSEAIRCSSDAQWQALYARGWWVSTSICFHKAACPDPHLIKMQTFPSSSFSLSHSFFGRGGGFVWRLPASDTCGRKVTWCLIFHGHAQRCA